MKWCWLLLGLWIFPLYANDCRCEIFAITPVTGAKGENRISLSDYRASYYGDTTLESQKACRSECRKSAMNGHDADILRAKLAPWLEEKIENKEVGRNCTGPTDFKVPVRVRARIGNFSLGLAHQSIVFYHRERSCLSLGSYSAPINGIARFNPQIHAGIIDADQIGKALSG